MFPNQTHLNSNNALPSLAWHPSHPSVQGRAEGTAVGAADAEGVPRAAYHDSWSFCSCRYCVFITFICIHVFFQCFWNSFYSRTMEEKGPPEPHVFCYSIVSLLLQASPISLKTAPPCKG